MAPTPEPPKLARGQLVRRIDGTSFVSNVHGNAQPGEMDRPAHPFQVVILSQLARVVRVDGQEATVRIETLPGLVRIDRELVSMFGRGPYDIFTCPTAQLCAVEETWPFRPGGDLSPAARAKRRRAKLRSDPPQES